MAVKRISVEDSTRLVARRPKQCAALFLKNLYPVLQQEDWFDKAWCLKFCASFLQNLVDQSIEQELDQALLNRIKHLPLTKAVSLMRHAPADSVKVLVVLISNQLRLEQKLSTEEQYAFYNELFTAFFPVESGVAVDPGREPRQSLSTVEATV